MPFSIRNGSCKEDRIDYSISLQLSIIQQIDNSLIDFNESSCWLVLLIFVHKFLFFLKSYKNDG
jgi:hypothetical protein